MIFQKLDNNKSFLKTGMDKPAILNKSLIYLFLIISSGLLLRIYNLGKMDFWFDEASSLFIARHFTEYTIRPDLPGPFVFVFNFLLSCWMRISSNDYFLRLLSVIFGVVSLIIVYFLGKLIFSRKTGILSALFLAVSPLHIYYSQELSGYSLSLFLALSSSYCFLKTLKKPSFLTSFFYIITTAGFIYNHSINLVIVLIQNLFFYLLYHKNDELKKKWLHLQLILLVICLPCLMLTFYRFFIFSHKDIYFWITRPGPQIPRITFMIFSLGYNAHWIPQLIALIIFIFLSLKAVYYWHKKRELLYLILWVIIPISTVWLISQIRPFYLHRLFFFTLPAFYLLAAAGAERINKLLLWSIVVIYLILASYSLKNYYENKLPVNYKNDYLSCIWPRKEYKESASYITEKFKKGDVILHICRSSFLPFFYYHKEKLPEYGIKLGDICKSDWPRVVGHTRRYSIIKFLEIERESDLRDYKRIWLVVSDWSFSGIKGKHDEYISKSMIAWFNRNFLLEEVRLFQGVNIYLYSRSKSDVKS